MFKNFEESSRRRIGNFVLLILALVVLAAAWGTVVRVQESMAEGRDKVRQSGQRIVEALDHELEIHVSHLRAMQYLADRFLSGRTRGTENPITRLQPSLGRDSYESVLPPDFGDLSTLGRITGSGKVPALNDPVAEEMTMAVGLTPLMRAIKERSADVPWVQYASARQFMFIFPHKGSEDFHFAPGLLQRDYFSKATPQANPYRSTFWSAPYEDAAGQGKIITVSQPIYRGDTFLGSVSIDFKVSSLSRFLGGVPIPGTHVHLVASDGTQTIAQAWGHQDDAMAAPHERIVLPMQRAPWAIEMSINEGELLLSALRGRMWHLGALGVLVMVFTILLILVRSYRRERDLSITDSLTGLYNRRHFDTVAPHQFEMARRGPQLLGLAILDIDFFKKFNDHYGHQHGDTVLQAIAKAIREALHRQGDQVFRVGGEEFAALMHLKTADELAPLLEKINQAVRDLNLPHVGNPFGIATVSIGAVAVEQENWISLEDAYKQADGALYQAKNNGRNRAVIQIF